MHHGGVDLTRFYPPGLDVAPFLAARPGLAINAPCPPYLDQPFTGFWLITDRGDPQVRALADRHYTRQTIGAVSFVRNGQNLVFVSSAGDAAWITFRPTPGKAERKDHLEAWECSLFRNEGPVLSSHLIIEAEALTLALWGKPPALAGGPRALPASLPVAGPGIGAPDHVRLDHCDQSVGLPIFTAPERPVLDWRLWAFKEGRGGVLREALTGWDGKAKIRG